MPPVDKSDHSLVPDADLNPLLNPLLVQNFGRWAEVYFTNPPERRAQAVADLVRELENESASQQPTQRVDRVSSVHATREHEPIATVVASQMLDANPDIVCSSCGHHDDEGQSFCVMCGAALEQPPQTPVAEKEITKFSAPREDQNFAERYDSYSVNETTEGADDLQPPSDEYYPLRSSEASSMYDELPSFARAEQPTPYRYRLYIGLAVIAVLAVLIYFARRGEVFSDGQESPAAKVVPAEQTSPPVPPPSAAPTSSANEPPLPVEKSGASEKVPGRPVADAPPPKSNEPDGPNALSKRGRLPEARLHAAAELASALPKQGGAEELADAQKYLSGAGGQATQAAVPLLWKAVAKGNAAATLTLSDMYLRGSGVPQNCDQARLLLDIAAKKGAKGAAERLQHLQAFGCR